MSAWRATMRRPFRSRRSEPTTNGMRAWSGRGAWRTPSNWYRAVWWVTVAPVEEAADDRQRLVEPVESLARACGPGRSRAPRSRTPGCRHRARGSTRPPLMWSTVAAILATTPGLRNGLAPTSRPSRTRVVDGRPCRQGRPALEERLERVAARRVEVVVAPEVVEAEAVDRLGGLECFRTRSTHRSGAAPRA